MSKYHGAGEQIDSLVFSEIRELAQERFPAPLRSYLTDGFNLVSAIALATSGPSPGELNDCVRELRLTSRKLGAARLVELCRELEVKGESASPYELNLLLRALYGEFAVVSELLEEEIRLSTDRAA